MRGTQEEACMLIDHHPDIRCDEEDPHDAISRTEALAEIRETLQAWQRGKEEIDASVEANPPNGSRRRRDLYQAQRDLLDSLSSEARGVLVEARYVVLDGTLCFCAVDIDGDLQVDSWPILAL